jgi:type IV pilus assembly protein PilC
VATDVGNGKSLFDAMMGKPGFNKLYCNLVKAGEAGGILDTVLDKMTEFMEKSAKTKKQIKKAMTYPSMVFVIGIGVVAGLMVFVVPQFVTMLEGSGQEVPGITKFVMNVSDFFVNYWHVMFVAGIAFVIFLKQYNKTEQGKANLDKIKMKMPLFGPVVIKGNLAGFTRTLSTLLSAGVSIIDAIEICTETLDNSVIAKDFERVKIAVVEGETLTKPLSRIKYFPEMVAQMVKVGEATGQLDSMLIKVSDVFEEEVDDAISTATSAIEPIIIVVLGGLIAGVMVAMYLPIFMSAGGAE